MPVWQDTPISSGEADEEGDDEGEEDDQAEEDQDGFDAARIGRKATGLVFFKITAISYDPLVSLEEDFRSSISSKARAGELGCWADLGQDGGTEMILDTLERDRVSGRSGDRAWHQAGKGRTFLSTPRRCRLIHSACT